MLVTTLCNTSIAGFQLNFKNEILLTFPDCVRRYSLTHLRCKYQFYVIFGSSSSTSISFHRHFVRTCTGCVFSFFQQKYTTVTQLGRYTSFFPVHQQNSRLFSDFRFSGNRERNQLTLNDRCTKLLSTIILGILSHTCFKGTVQTECQTRWTWMTV